MGFKAYLFHVLLSGFISAFFTTYLINQDIKENKVKGYHCQPITTHSTLEDAKAKVIEYQERVK